MDLDFSDQDLAFRALIATTFPSGSVYDEAIWHAAQAVGPDWAQAEVTRYFEGRAGSIAGGTDEAQRNIIAKHVLKV